MKILGSLLLLISLLYANLQVYLKQNPITLGEPAELIIEASGQSIEFPKIDKIGSYPVSGIAKSESIVNINGKMSIKRAQTLTFYPDQNMTIPPLTVKIDGKKVQSQPIKLIVKPASKNSDITFSLRANKKEAYVSEPIIIEMILKIRRGINIVDYSFIPPSFDNFWVKQLRSSNKYLEEHGAFLIKRIKFLAIPQKSGTLRITPAIFKYAIPTKSSDLFGFFVTAPTWKSVFSNALNIVVKPLPKDVEIVGDFHIEAKVDKREVQANDPVNFTVTIEGVGNLENIDKIPLNIANVTVYENKPTLQEHIENSQLHAKLIQKFSIIANHSYTIPSIDLEYLSLKEKRIKHLKTKPISIVVHSKAPMKIESTKEQKGQNITAPTQTNIVKKDGKSFWIGFVVGLLVAVLIGWFIWIIKRKKDFSLKWKDKRELLKRVLPYVSEDERAASLAQALYEEIYEGKKHKISKKDVEEVLKKICTSTQHYGQY